MLFKGYIKVGSAIQIFGKCVHHHLMYFVYMVCLISILYPYSSQGQITPALEIGTPFTQNFTPEDYQASSQNWDFVQDSLGLIYIANGRGLLIYNGESFDLLKMPQGQSVRSVAIDGRNRIYCGGGGYFGYLTYDRQGKVNFVNLADSISIAGSFSNVEDIYATPKGIYFRSPEKLILWKKGYSRIWECGENRFLSTFWVHDKLFVNRKYLGIQVISDQGEFHPLDKDSFFADKTVTVILPIKDDLLIGTQDHLFLYKENNHLDFPGPANDLLGQARLFKGRVLNNGTYALSTLNDGMLIVDQGGQILLHGNVNNGLPSNTIFQIYQKNEGQLWIASNNGIALMEYSSPFTGFNIDHKTPPITAIERYENQLIIGTFHGLFRVIKSAYPPAYSEPYLEIKDRIWDLLAIGEDLFIGYEDGLYLKTAPGPLKKIEADATSVLYRSQIDTNRIFVGSRKGIYALHFSDGIWKRESVGFDVGESVYHINEQNDGTLWLDVNKPWIYRVTYSNKSDAAKLIEGVCTKLDSADGLPGVNGYLMMHQDRIYYVDNVDFNMLGYDSEMKFFSSDFTVDSKFAEAGDSLVIANNDKRQNKWLVEFAYGEIKNTFLSSPSISDGQPIKLNEARIYSQIGRVIYYDDGVLWHGGQNALIRNNIGESSTAQPFNTIIDEVYYQEDSLVHRSPYCTAYYRFPFFKNSFRFTYTNTAHIANDHKQYQYYLNGHMDEWSDWSFETKRDFTNLMEGKYTFSVRSKGDSGVIGLEDTFGFEILAPLHRTWFAYFLYIFFGLAGTTAIVRWRSESLRKEKLALQRTVELRTAELEARNIKLEKQRLQLSEQTAKLKEIDLFKSRLFANISHEFRTPLTLIKGPIEKLKRFPESQITEAHVAMMDRNANRLLRLVNQILDLSKIDARNLPLDLSEGDVFKSIRTCASSFSSLASDRNMDYQILVPAGQLWAAFDRDKLEKIIYNLLSNAFKFTQDTGEIKLSVSRVENRLKLEVSDNGIGISSTNLPRIFERFYQVDNDDTKVEEGSGVGLSLVGELVNLMGGKVKVKSIPERGSSFVVELPMKSLGFTDEAEESPTLLQGNVFGTSNMLSRKIEKAKGLNTILLVEDNPDMRLFIREHLESKYDILEACSGQEGLKIAVDKMPDLIVSDLMMPKMDGLELCQIIKSDFRTSHIPVIILTAKAGLGNKIEGLVTGADVYLTKPFHVEELLVQVNRLIQGRARLRALFSQRHILEPKNLDLPKLDEEFIGKLLNVLENNFDDADFNVPQLQQILTMSRTQLHRKMKALTGMPPGEFIRHYRLQRAAQILMRGDRVAETAYSVGFNNLSYFARSFRALFGVSPKDYARQAGKG